ASCALASLSGSAAADAAALAALIVPMMVAAGHSKMYAAGLVAAGGIIAPVIPPSIGFVLFGVAGGVSISKLFLAGIVPGLMLGVGLCFAWWWVARGENIESPPRKSFREIALAIIDGFWALMLPVIIVVGLRFGIFTPTEAAVVVAVYALFVATCIYRELKLSQLYEVFVSAAMSTSVVMFLVAAALVSSWLITVAEIATQVVDLVRPFMGNQTLLMLAIMVLVVIVGTALDMAPTILILTPILMPIIKQAGIDPVYFGVLFIINNAIGLITPPVGVVLNVVCGVSRISMEDIIKARLRARRAGAGGQRTPAARRLPRVRLRPQGGGPGVRAAPARRHAPRVPRRRAAVARPWRAPPRPGQRPRGLDPRLQHRLLARR
ncbi:MAG TPA: TRAP transporter large permease subunit, partial [Anaeromyxobacteraceae bacterium]|nr:TRAP transporter large permease subunit [Anaeromyxobacteraceae bacterium]